MKPVCITFAGVPGSSKTPIAHHLSCVFNLPILANDVIRTELREDTLSNVLDQYKYLERVIQRIESLTEKRRSFIYDASNDRHWYKFLQNKGMSDYEVVVISIDLTRSFYMTLLDAKKYEVFMNKIDTYMKDHENFLENSKMRIICHINDDNFSHRLETAEASVKTF